MANNRVEVSARADLEKIIADFDGLREAMTKVSKTFEETGKDTGNTFRDQTKKTETYLGKMGNMGRDVLGRLKDDFKSLLSMNALVGGMKLSESFRGSIKEAVTLSDAIRKLGPVFGLTATKFSSFQDKLMKGLGDIGLGSEAAANALEGLSQTQVRGEGALVKYSETAGMLASVGREKGREGDIAKGIAGVITARGGDVNDMKQMSQVAEDLRRVFLTTGKSPTETLQAMQSILTSMPQDLRKSLTTKGLSSLAVASSIAGPNSTKFLEEYLSKGKIGRAKFEAFGFKDVITEKGIDIEKFKKQSSGLMGLIKQDPRMAANILGIGDDAAEGFVRLAESLDKVKDAQENLNQMSGNLTDTYKQNRTLGESWNANLNKLKSFFAKPIGYVTQGLTDALGKTSESTGGAAATILGGGVLAALMTGVGLKGLGKGLGMPSLGGLAKREAFGQFTGKEVQDVYVVNASDMGGGGGMVEGMLAGQGMSKASGMLAKAFPWIGAAAAGIGLGVGTGMLVNKGLDSYTQGTTDEGFEGNALERLFFKLDKLFGGEASTTFMKNQKVLVEMNDKQLKATVQPTRGASQ